MKKLLTLFTIVAFALSLNALPVSLDDDGLTVKTAYAKSDKAKDGKDKMTKEKKPKKEKKAKKDKKDKKEKDCTRDQNCNDANDHRKEGKAKGKDKAKKGTKDK